MDIIILGPGMVDLVGVDSTETLTGMEATMADGADIMETHITTTTMAGTIMDMPIIAEEEILII